MMRALTASLFIKVSILLIAIAQTACSEAARQQRCPDTMAGASDAQFVLDNVYIIRFDEGNGSREVPALPSTEEPVVFTWALERIEHATYRAACEYAGEVIGVPIDHKYSRCWLERRQPDSAKRPILSAWCS